MEFPLEQRGTFEALSTVKDTSTYFYAFASYITNDYPKKEERNPSSKITLVIDPKVLNVSITDLKTNKTWSKNFGLSDTAILKKDENILVLNLLTTIENTNDEGIVVNKVEKKYWFPLIFEKYKNGWTVNFINGPWDTKSKKQFEEKNEENGILILNDLDHDDLEKINKVKTNRLFQTRASEIYFSPISESKYDEERFKKYQKNQKNALKIEEKKIKSETRYCRKAYNWLYKREVGNQPMAYIIKVNLPYGYMLEKTMVDDKNNSIRIIDIDDEYVGFDFPTPLYNDVYLELDSISIDEIPDLCKLHNIIPNELANEIKQRNLIYTNLEWPDWDGKVAYEILTKSNVNFNLDFFNLKIKPYIDSTELLLKAEQAEDFHNSQEDCGCGMGGFLREDYIAIKKGYKEAKKSAKN